MSGARDLAQVLARGPAALPRYERALQRRFAAWRRVVEYFYQGELFALVRMARSYQSALCQRFLVPHVRKQITWILTGLAAESRYSQGVLSYLVKRNVSESSSQRLRVR